jgi:hypothetical protein
MAPVRGVRGVRALPRVLAGTSLPPCHAMRGSAQRTASRRSANDARRTRRTHKGGEAVRREGSRPMTRVVPVMSASREYSLHPMSPPPNPGRFVRGATGPRQPASGATTPSLSRATSRRYSQRVAVKSNDLMCCAYVVRTEPHRRVNEMENGCCGGVWLLAPRLRDVSRVLAVKDVGWERVERLERARQPPPPPPPPRGVRLGPTHSAQPAS